MSLSPHPDFPTLPLLDVACQANFSQVSHCLSNSLTDLTDMHSKFANCNMQWHKGRERDKSGYKQRADEFRALGGNATRPPFDHKMSQSECMKFLTNIMCISQAEHQHSDRLKSLINFVKQQPGRVRHNS